MIVIGLTGSIGMGKSVTSRLFMEEGGGPVQSADDVVHRLYGVGRRGTQAIAELAPQAISGDGSVDRTRLRERIRRNPDLLKRVEAAIHPLVREERNRFVANAKEAGAPFVVLEIPLLFETGAEKGVDKVVVVTAPESVQRERVLARPGWTRNRIEGWSRSRRRMRRNCDGPITSFRLETESRRRDPRFVQFWPRWDSVRRENDDRSPGHTSGRTGTGQPCVK